jgi:hypothetical protein
VDVDVLSLYAGRLRRKRQRQIGVLRADPDVDAVSLYVRDGIERLHWRMREIGRAIGRLEGLDFGGRRRSAELALDTAGKFLAMRGSNLVNQGAYALANFRGGVRRGNVFVEGWTRNAFDTHYILTALPYPGLAPSGFIGETGAPRTFGVRAGMTF